MTALENIYKELSERMKDEPNKNMILGYTMGIIEKYKTQIIEEAMVKFSKEINKIITNE